MSQCVFGHDTACTHDTVCMNENAPDVYRKRCIEADSLMKKEQTFCKYHYEGQALYMESGIFMEENKSMSSDNVISHPSHYTDGRKYEPKDVIRDWNLNFNLGSAVKYISRAGRKDDIIQDLKKAKQFIDFEIEALMEEQEKAE